MYAHVPVMPPQDGQDEVEASLASEITFAKNDGAIAAIIHVLGLRQGDQIIGGETHLMTFHMTKDGKFIEVADDTIHQGTCKQQPS